MTKGAKLFSVVCFTLVCSVTPRSAKADEWDKKTILSFSGPVQVQNTRLEAGTYVFKLADTADRHVVQIFNQDETQVIATIMAIPDYRLEPTGKTAIKFSETAEGATTSGTVPEAGVPIKEWFYPGDNFGQEFKVVPQPIEIATAEPAAPPPAESEPAPAPAPPAETSEAAEPTEQPQAQEATPAPTQQQAPEPAPAPAQTETPTSLPKTASSMPLIGLVSVLSLAAAGGLRIIAKREG
jgi:outer membrane biosynthesis protein TonB